MRQLIILLLVMAGVAWTSLAMDSVTCRADSLTLQVDPFSGVTSIINPIANASLSIDGYQLTSAAGTLSVANWHSLADANVSGWSKVPSSTTGLAELNLTSSSAIASGANLNLGQVFTPYATEDVSFKYSIPSVPQVAIGTVQYVGGLQLAVHTVVSNHAASVETVRVVLVNPESVPITTDGDCSLEGLQGARRER